jgi:hypothetical protein
MTKTSGCLGLLVVTLRSAVIYRLGSQRFKVLPMGFRLQRSRRHHGHASRDNRCSAALHDAYAVVLSVDAEDDINDNAAELPHSAALSPGSTTSSAAHGRAIASSTTARSAATPADYQRVSRATKSTMGWATGPPSAAHRSRRPGRPSGAGDEAPTSVSSAEAAIRSPGRLTMLHATAQRASW